MMLSSSWFSRWKKKSLKILSRNKALILIILLAYAQADLLLLYVRPLFLEDGTVRQRTRRKPRPSASLTKYMAVWHSNIFHDGDIPPSFSEVMIEQAKKQIVPVKSQLPLTLNGTVVYRDTTKSVANITHSTSNDAESYKEGDTIHQLARVTKITTNRVYFVNMGMRREEYIELVEKTNLPQLEFRGLSARQGTGDGLVKLVGENQRVVKRSDINKYFQNLPDVLLQAATSRHVVNGQMVGFRLDHIKKGSIFSDLGLQVGDIMKSFNGEPLRSELQAAELFHQHRGDNRWEMIVMRDNKEVPMVWEVNEDVSHDNPSPLPPIRGL